MHRPLELLCPVARNDEHHELADARLERAAEAQVLADLLQTLHQLGTAQERNELAFDPAARTGGQLGCGGALGVGHLRRLERRHAFYVGHGLSFFTSATALSTSRRAAL